MNIPFEVKYIGDSKEIPIEQHFKLTALNDSSLVIYAKTKDEAIKSLHENTLDFLKNTLK